MTASDGTTLLGPRPLELAAVRIRPEQVGFATRRLRRLDLVLFLAVLGLCLLGTVLVAAAVRARTGGGPDGSGLILRHLIALLTGLVGAAMVAGCDPRRLRMLTPVVLGVSTVGLLVALSPLGRRVNGAQSWLHAGPLSVQPVELAKVSLVLGLAFVLAERRAMSAGLPIRHEGRPAGFRRRELAWVLGLGAVPIGLVLVQPDLGSAVVLLAILAGVLWVAEVPGRWLGGLILLAAVGVGLVLMLDLLSPYQLERLAVFVDPGEDPSGTGYNAAQARIAVAAGGLSGAGLFQGSQTVGQFVPEQHTDFIFTLAGEQLGLAGGGLILALLGVILWRAATIMRDAADLFATLLCAGVVAWFTVQSFLNIGMTLGLTPITGLPLPLVSYGGSAMVANLVAVGLLLNVAANSRP